MKKIILFMILLSLVSCGKSSVPQTAEKKCQTAVNSSLSSATYKAGVSVAVYSGKYDTWTYAAGKASESSQMSTSSQAFAFSITKTMLSAMVLTQIETLGSSDYTLKTKAMSLLDSSDTSALSGATGINLDATVEELLTHTSGMYDYATNSKADVSKLESIGSYNTTTWSPLDVLALVPGSYNSANTYNYASTNYILLGMIAEQQGKDTLNSILYKTFFNTLGITAVLAPQDSIPAGIVSPYDQYALASLLSADLAAAYPALMTMYGDLSTGVNFVDLVLGLTVNLNLLTGRAAWAAGGIIATADNLAKWGYELYSPEGKAVSASVRKLILDSAPNDGDYGYGVEKTSFTYSDGTTGSFYGHSGDGPGGKTILAYDPDLDMSVAVVLNASANYDALMNSGSTDASLGLVDRKELVKTIFSAFKAEQTDSL